MRVLVTGATGHVGGAIAAHLTAHGYDVVGLTRDPAKAADKPYEPICADIAQPGLAETLMDELPRCQAMVHAAASLASSPYDLSLSATNGAGTQQVLELAARWEVASFVYLSGLPVIGAPSQLPVTEEHPARPSSPYLASKLYGEHLVDVAQRQGLAGVSLRVTSPIGPGMRRDRILAVFVQRALAGERLEVAGHGLRGQDYVDVRDVAAAVQSSLEQGARGLLNIGSGRCISNLDLAELCVGVVGSESEVRLTGNRDSEDAVRWEVSIAKARTMIGYQPRCSLEDSIANIAAAWSVPERV